jgi:histidinol-phosphate aminotransferase
VSIARLARPEIQALQPYAAAPQVADTVRLNANEAPWTSSIDRFRRPLNRYPEIRPKGLQNALAERYGCRAEQLLVTRGTSEAIDLLIRVFCRAGIDSILTTSPSFSMYKHYAQIQGASVTEIPASRDDNFVVSAADLLASCNDSTRIIFVCSPNNPTGTLFSRAELVELLDRRCDRSAVVVDEAYIEFADEPSAAELLDRYDNLIVLRTLSKALACAGARCGSVLGPSSVIDMLDAIQAPYALATPVVEWVENALEQEVLEESATWVRQIIAARNRLADSLARFSFVRRIWPSSANFLLIEVDDTELLLRRSRDHNVLLRYFGGSLANCVRVTVGSPAENAHLLQTFAATESD